MLAEQSHPVILFDGVCNLCSGVVQFINKHDAKKQFRFASLQSKFGEEVMKHFRLPIDQFNSFILFENKKIYTRSTGALKVAKKLNGLYPLLYGFIIVPRFIRDAVYNLVARKRYQWFGKKETCWIPTPELKNLFIDSDESLK
jgi:predicted DCC family thiol-disulfide oxidoreductase YuxK